MVRPLFFLHPLSSRTFPLSARKSALLASLAQNAKFVTKLWTIATPVSLFIIYNRLRRKELGFPGVQTLTSLGSCFFFFQVSKSSFVHCLCGWDWRKFSSQFADFWCWDTNCWHSPQDKKTAVLNTNPVFFTTATYMTLEENAKGLTSILFVFVLGDSLINKL